MQKILLVRLSAMGDIVHALPAISDIRRRWPRARIDCAVDTRFAEIVAAHPAVDRVIALPLKSWKTSRVSLGLLREIASIVRDLRSEQYDAVLDLHGVIKSAIVCRLARSTQRFGPGWGLCAEKLALCAYSRRLGSDPCAHPVARMRRLAALALDTDDTSLVDFGLTALSAPLRQSRVVLAHSSSCDAKLWPEKNWIALGRALRDLNFEVILPWGTEAEALRSQRIACEIHGGEVPAECKSLTVWLNELPDIALLVGVDTGLTHLAAAVGTPCIALFMATDPALFVAQNPAQARALGRLGRGPDLAEVWRHICFLLGMSATEPVLLKANLRAPPQKVRRKSRLLLGPKPSHGV